MTGETKPLPAYRCALCEEFRPLLVPRASQETVVTTMFDILRLNSIQLVCFECKGESK